MDRLEVAFVLTQMLEEAERVNSLKINDIKSTQWAAAQLVSQYLSKYWWACVGSGLILHTVRNYTDNCFDIVPSKHLQAFIDFVIYNKDSSLVSDSLKIFPLVSPNATFYIEEHNAQTW